MLTPLPSALKCRCDSVPTHPTPEPLSWVPTAPRMTLNSIAQPTGHLRAPPLFSLPQQHSAWSSPTSFCLECSSHSLHYTHPPHLHCHMLLRKVCLTFAVTGSYSTHTCFSFRSLGAATTLQLLVQLRLTLICLSNHVSLVLLMLRIEPLVLSTPWMLEKYL